MSASESSQNVLITAAGGRIGSDLIPMLLKDQAKHKLILPTRNASRLIEKYQAYPAQIAVEEGDIQDAQWVETILKKHEVTEVFLCLNGVDELFITLNFFSAMRNAGSVKHLVYLSACGDFSLEAIKAGLLKDTLASHVNVKVLIEAQLKYGMLPPTSEGGFTYTVIAPTLFFDNDLRSKEAMMEQNFFDEPRSSKGHSRVCTLDIALAAYKSLVQDRGRKHHGDKIMIGSKKAYTAADIRDLWSQNLRKDIRILDCASPSDLEKFEEQFKAKTGPAWTRDMRLMYEWFAAVPFVITDEDYQKQVAFLGKEPEDYGRFVKETAEQWLAEQE